mmetsp:Transcript_658/g.2631  ORF Transcript_658/g.2631 Transcript_658/m.2631 type:complete len:89 (+) Transcript_658:952-1218(+)
MCVLSRCDVLPPRDDGRGRRGEALRTVFMYPKENTGTCVRPWVFCAPDEVRITAMTHKNGNYYVALLSRRITGMMRDLDEESLLNRDI